MCSPAVGQPEELITVTMVAYVTNSSNLTAVAIKEVERSSALSSQSAGTGRMILREVSSQFFFNS